MNTEFIPSTKVLRRYAQVLVNFALNGGAGVKKNEVVHCLVPDVAKPLALELQKTILRAGAHPMIQLLPTGFEKDFFELASPEQYTFFPQRYLEERAKLIDHSLHIIADVDPMELASTDPAKIMSARNAKRPYRDWLRDKETQGKYTWTIGLWGTQAKADVVGLSLEEYWNQIISACLLDKADPVLAWTKLVGLQKEILAKINALEIEKLSVLGPDVDLTIRLGADRAWQGGSGRNIPSFEIFTSPDWRGTEGWIRFNQPVYRYGNIIGDVFLRFENGLVVEAKAKRGQKLLTEMLKTPNANKAGEFSLTDHRMSRITHTMAETLFDENIGGPFGNTHIAIGMAYRDCFKGDQAALSKADWEARGYNDSAEHTDFVSTTDRTVTAFLTDGSQKVIYKKGKFVL